MSTSFAGPCGVRARIDDSRKRIAFSHYLAVRAYVGAILEGREATEDEPSPTDSIGGYLLDASPLVVESIRDHYRPAEWYGKTVEQSTIPKQQLEKLIRSLGEQPDS